MFCGHFHGKWFQQSPEVALKVIKAIPASTQCNIHSTALLLLLITQKWHAACFKEANLLMKMTFT